MTVQPLDPLGSDSVYVTNGGNKPYKVQITVNGKPKGTSTIKPGSTATLYSTNVYGSSTIVTTVMDNKGTTLWKVTNIGTKTYSSEASNVINPFYTDYIMSVSTQIGSDSQEFIGVGVGHFYSQNAVTQGFDVGGVSLTRSGEIVTGVAGTAELGMNGPGCNTFVGARISCTYSCDMSVGLEICVNLGAKEFISPFHTFGCGFSCCAEIATVSCELFSAGYTMSATFNK